MINLRKHTFLITALLFCTILLIACQSTSSNKTDPENLTDHNRFPHPILNTTVTAAFSPSGRLWRLVPTEQAVFIDYSDNQGLTFSTPVQVNPQPQKISAWPENPPVIKIGSSGRIHVLYYADEQQRSTSFYSYSDDQGQTFSTPALVSDHAKTAMHYMDKMLVDDNDKLYLFWHDTRHDSSHPQDLGNGVLSLYYSIKPSDDQTQFKSHFLSAGICSCCRTAATLAGNGKPIIFARMVYENGVRDHALIKMNPDSRWQKPQRVTHDNWSIEACPEHGPAIAIDDHNRIHFSWFTLGDIRQGIFYAHTDDDGKTVSAPMLLGNPDHLPSHPDVITLGNRVVIAWEEFNGESTSIKIKESMDRGKTWIDKTTPLKSASKNSHPKLIAHHTDLFLSWVSEEKGHQILKL